MPIKTSRTIDVERRLAERVATERQARGLSYEGLAALMKEAGCDIHPSGIQKTEKSGRRITVEELVGYAAAFRITPEDLLGRLGDVDFNRAVASLLAVADELSLGHEALADRQRRIARMCIDPELGADRRAALEEALDEYEDAGPGLAFPYSGSANRPEVEEQYAGRVNRYAAIQGALATLSSDIAPIAHDAAQRRDAERIAEQEAAFMRERSTAAVEQAEDRPRFKR